MTAGQVNSAASNNAGNLDFRKIHLRSGWLYRSTAAKLTVWTWVFDFEIVGK